VTFEAIIVLGLVIVMLTILARTSLGPDIGLGGGAVVLMALHGYSARFPSPAQFAANFGNEGVLAIAVLYVVAAGLTETGGMSLIADRMLGRPRASASAPLRVMAPVAALSSVVNNTPIVAMFLPIVQDWSTRAGMAASKLLLPLSYAAVLGGMCTLIGTSTNLVVQALLIDAHAKDPNVPIMDMFTLTPIGVPIAIAGIVFVTFAARRMLPDRRPRALNLEDTRQYTIEMMVEPQSPIDGLTIEEAGLRHLPGVYLARLEREDISYAAVGPEQRLRAADRLVFVGVVDSVVDLRRMRGLQPANEQLAKVNGHRHDRCLVEAVVSNTSPLIGRSVREGRFRSRYDAAIIAVHRNGERINRKIGDVVLAAGDTLLIETHPQFLKYHRNSRDFFLISPIENSHPRRYERGWIALGIVVAMVAAVALGRYTHIGLLTGALLAAGLMLMCGCCSIDQARRSIDWSVVVAIAAALGIGQSIESTGLGAAAAQTLVGAAHGGPWLVLAQLYRLTMIFAEVVGHNAAAAIAFPVSQAAAASLGVSFLPFAVGITIAASTGFALPFIYQTHLMVFGAGGYRVSDFVKIGVPLDLLAMGIALGLLPFVYPF
jgi:di/tricarboxylate transporter